MELEEEEAQICRLCGQCESIYIDVFGEEGTKRFLGLKIHTKINILIKENDGLPQRVCMRCLGTLEFLCDFYERCHLTQKDLLEANRNMTEAEYRKLESDAESDKENALPSANEVKRKIRTISPDSTRSTKSCLTTKNSQYYKTDRKDGTNVHHADIKTTNKEVVQPVAQTSVQLSNLISKTKSTTDVIDAHEEKLEDDENHCGTLKFEKVLEEKEDLKETQTTRSGIMNKSLNSIPKSTAETYTGVKSEQRVRQKRGRKSKLEKMRQANQLSKYVSVKRGLQKDLEGKKYDDTTDRLKRHCLRTICANKSDTSIVSKSQNERELVSKEQTSIESISTESHTVSNDSSIGSNNNKTSKKLLETQESCKASGKSHDCIKKSEDGLTKSKQVSVIVKQEKPEIEEDASQQGIPFVWIAAEMFTQKPENPKSQKEKVLSHMSPPPGDEAERSKSSESNSMVEDKVLKQSGISNCANYEDLRPVTFMEQNRVTVIKSSQNSDVIASEAVKHCHLEVNHLDDIIDQSTRDSLESDVLERSLSRRSSRDSSFSGNKSKDGKFGKISELISEEQKETIETYYRVDMSIVNSEEVKRNITIVDKKNIKCNICGTLYLRMDKCKVHIWGHLKMKPYQCNACDFATVTVSNVRCHIRKSHLKIKPFACHLCEKRYVTAVLLEEHLNTHTGARPFKCKVCDFASASRQMLSYHNTTHKPIKDVSCKICGKEFYSRGRLRAHMLIHNKDKVVMCKLCSAYLSNAGALETHHKNIHMRDYICNVCGKHVKSRKALHNHQNVHAAAKYKCSLCPNVYKSSQILKEHLLKHEGIRKYKCNVCEKSFAQQSHLAAHMAVHSKIRFHCPGCDKAFNRHDNMKIHTKRCKPFLANPELKNLLTRKGRTKLSGGMTDSVTLSSNTDTSKSPRRVKDQTEETSTKIVNDTKKTDMNLCKLGLNISCIETMDKSWEHNVQGAGDITNSTDIHVLHITKVNDKLIPENENLTIHENILGPESF